MTAESASGYHAARQPSSQTASHILQRGLALIVGCFTFIVTCASTLDAPRLKPVSGPWKSDPKSNLSEKTRRSVSGIACAPNSGEQICLVVFDEGIEARHAVLRSDSLVAETPSLKLLSSGRELDAEGAAFDGRYFYVTGSHSTSRKSCAPNPDSRHVIRFQANPATGRAKGDSNGLPTDYQETGRLWDVMSASKELKQYVDKCLGTQAPLEGSGEHKGERGINIEGLAIKHGRLYFGFRGPSRNGAVPILSVNAEALFSNGPLEVKTVYVAVGDGRGIRDMVAVQEGFLLLVGPDDDQRKDQPSSMILFWDGSGSGETTVNAKPLAQLIVSESRRPKCDKETKPEALTVLAESPAAYKVLVLSDGMCDGGPLAFDIKR